MSIPGTPPPRFWGDSYLISAKGLVLRSEATDLEREDLSLSACAPS